MSKIGQQPIFIPSGVRVEVDKSRVLVKGPKGELSIKIRPEIEVSVNSGEQEKVLVTRKKTGKLAKSLHGLTRSLIANMIIGVEKGFSKTLKIMGTGYRAKLEGGQLILSVGHSHPVKVKPSEGIEFKLKGNDLITVSGVDKQLVGQVAAQIRQIRPPDPYKGKGIRYQGEIVRRKPGKAAKTGAV